MADTDISNTISTAAAWDLIHAYQQLRDKGIVPDNELADIEHFSPATISRIPEKTLVKIWQQLVRAHPSPEIGLIIGTTITSEAKGVLASWVSQSEDLREALSIFREHIALMNPSENWKVEDIGQSVVLTLTIVSRERYPVAAIERSMSALVSWARMLTSHPIPIERATFCHSPPEYIDKYYEIFGHHLSFEAQQCQLVFASDLLNLKVVSSNHYLREVMAKTARLQLEAMSSTRSLHSQVAAIITNSLHDGQLPNIEAVAKQLHISRQTLYRKLDKEQTTFQIIVDDTRKQLATEQLSQAVPPTITELSYNLGFKETSSLYKAFRRWFGMTPKAFLIQRHSK